MTTRKRNGRAKAAGGGSGANEPSAFAPVPPVVGGAGGSAPAHRQVPQATSEALDYLAQRDDGWLRLIPSRDGHPVYCKWKFTSGRYANHYVMALGQWWQMDYILAMLIHKIEEVDVGILRHLAKDTLYNHANDERTDG
jgi:hypothetical protein